jgi:RNA polymerase sigma-70 factor (ECF subfamily)
MRREPFPGGERPKKVVATTQPAPSVLGAELDASSEPDDDQALLTRARVGDQAALELLLRRHYPRLYAVCRRLTGDDADAADATQNAAVNIVRNIARFDGQSSFATWAYRVAVNASFDELRRRRRRGLGVVEERSVPAAAGQRDGTEAVAMRVDIDAALQQLPQEFRVAVVLRDLCGLDYAEIAHLLGVPPGTVRSRIARGRAALLPLLGDDPGTDPGASHGGPR